MSNYKIIMCLILIILIGSFIWWRESKINELDKAILENQKTISLQDEKIKEQLSIITLLQEDQKNKETSIESLLVQLNESKSNCESLLSNMSNLHEISAAGKNCPITNNESTGENHVVDKETSNKFINLRNSIIRNYR